MLIDIETFQKEEIISIREPVEKVLEGSSKKEGVCFVYLPHTTAALTINESADPNIKKDFLNNLKKMIPEGVWLHDKIDNNGAAHMKAGLIGHSLLIPVKQGCLQLGRWQDLWLCEFDGPRKRQIFVQLL